MNITAEFNMSGSIDAIIDGVRMNIPDDMGNRYRQILADWEALGNRISPYIAPAPQPRLVLKRVIVDRLQVIGKLAAARAALDAQPLYVRERWNARDSVYATDPDTISLLTAIGADPAIILAP